MARITENSIEKVRLKSDIIQTISDYMELKKRGHNFFGLSFGRFVDYHFNQNYQ